MFIITAVLHSCAFSWQPYLKFFQVQHPPPVKCLPFWGHIQTPTDKSSCPLCKYYSLLPLHFLCIDFWHLVHSIKVEPAHLDYEHHMVIYSSIYSTEALCINQNFLVLFMFTFTPPLSIAFLHRLYTLLNQFIYAFCYHKQILLPV